MRIVYKKKIDVPNNFFCNKCKQLKSEKTNGKTRFYCDMSKAYLIRNVKTGQIIKNQYCIDNILASLEVT